MIRSWAGLTACDLQGPCVLAGSRTRGTPPYPSLAFDPAQPWAAPGARSPSPSQPDNLALHGLASVAASNSPALLHDRCRPAAPTHLREQHLGSGGFHQATHGCCDRSQRRPAQLQLAARTPPPQLLPHDALLTGGQLFCHGVPARPASQANPRHQALLVGPRVPDASTSTAGLASWQNAVSSVAALLRVDSLRCFTIGPELVKTAAATNEVAVGSQSHRRSMSRSRIPLCGCHR